MIYIKSDILSSDNSVINGFVYQENSLNINDLAHEIGLGRIKTVKQVHGNEIIFLNDPDQCEENYEADAIVTGLKGLGIGVYTADCVPIIISDEERKICGVVHAGWRGTLSRITEEVSEFMINKLGCSSENIKAAIGPCIEGECYEIGNEIAAQFEASFNNSHIYLTKKEGTKYSLDLRAANTEQLKRRGITTIETIDICTKCNTDYPSYRRDGKNAGRMLSFIGLV